jgi:hypothetical protein
LQTQCKLSWLRENYYPKGVITTYQAPENFPAPPLEGHRRYIYRACARIIIPSFKNLVYSQEFKEKYKRSYADHDLFYKVRINHPIDDLEAGYIQLYKLQEKLKAFSVRVVEYYRGSNT